MVIVPKRTQEKLPAGEPEQIRKKGIILDCIASYFERVINRYVLIYIRSFNS